MTDDSRRNQRREFLLVIGAIVCVGIGAAATYWIVRATRRAAHAPVIVREGQPLISAGARRAESPSLCRQPQKTAAAITCRSRSRC